MSIINKQQAREVGAQLGETFRQLKLTRSVALMEVCGTHTHALFRSGIRSLLPPEIRLISGPGCPVCVTPPGYVDLAQEIASYSDVIITTFGDMMRVPGSKGSLLESQANGADIRIVYSPLDVLEIARSNPAKKIIFLAVGFETTVPTVAATIERAATQGLANLTFLTAHKVVPNALRALLNDPEISLDGFLLPGHVSTITGFGLFSFLREEYRIPAVVAGFEPVEMLAALIKLSTLAASKQPSLVNVYGGLVTEEGNIRAQALVEKVFTLADVTWRGIGTIPGSGLVLKPEYSNYDARLVFGLEESQNAGPAGCLCGEILKGKKTPPDCSLFKTVCNPEKPVGPCMVSSEGTCGAYYKYHQ